MFVGAGKRGLSGVLKKSLLKGIHEVRELGDRKGYLTPLNVVEGSVRSLVRLFVSILIG
jgi:hypothetical protein